MIIKYCLICPTPIKVSPSQLTSKKTCSKVCDAKWRKESGIFSGENNPAYKGGIAIYTNGKKRDKPYSQRFIIGHSKKISESRYNMEQLIGRPLKKEEIIHHINGNSLDNRPENLLLTDKKHHSYYHINLISYNSLLQEVKELRKENEFLKAKLISLSASPLL